MSAAGRLRLEVFHHLFAAAAEEMGESLKRSAFSPNIKERRDFSCALFDSEGRMIAQAAHLPVHLGAAPLSVRAVLDTLSPERGDAVLLNDPFAGGTHLPDLTLVSPVFLPGEDTPRFYCANRAHHADVGGHHPGSMAPARDVHGEGLRIPPVRIVRGGKIDDELLSLLLANMRVGRERRGDLLAQWAANRVGAARLLEMSTDHGGAELSHRAAQLLDWTDELCGALLSSLPNGEWRFEDSLEGAGDEPAVIRLRLAKHGDRIVADFSGSDPQRDGAVNTTRAVAVSAVFYCLRLLLPSGTPTNEGVLRRAEIITEPGSLVDARYPAPVAAGNVETSQRLVDVVLGALAQVLPDRIPAASAGTMSNLSFGAANGSFAYYETIAGGAGGGPLGPGAHALQTHMTNTRNTPIEALENELPIQVLATTVRRGSGGAGAHPGGDGVRRRLRFLEAVRLSWIAERQRSGPWGLAGGEAGSVGSARVSTAPGRRMLRTPAPFSVDLASGAEVELETPGGGGHGPRA